MKLVYSRRALTDLDEIAAYYSASASPAIAESIGRRLESVIDRICRVPRAAPRVSQRSAVRVVTRVGQPHRSQPLYGGRTDVLAYACAREVLLLDQRDPDAESRQLGGRRQACGATPDDKH